MPARNLPGLGLRAFWDHQENGWHGDPGMDGNLRRLSIYTQLSVISANLTVPPASPVNGAIYIVGQGATGAWAGQSGKIAARDNNQWVFLDALNGLIAYVDSEDTYYRYDNGWFPLLQPFAFSAFCNYRKVFNAANAWEIIPCNVGRHNDQGIWSAATNTFTAPRPGYYQFNAGWTFDVQGTIPDFIAVGLSVNAAVPTPDAQDRYTATMTALETSVNTQAVLKLAANDTVAAVALISSGGGAIVADRNRFSGFKIM